VATREETVFLTGTYPDSSPSGVAGVVCPKRGNTTEDPPAIGYVRLEAATNIYVNYVVLGWVRAYKLWLYCTF
jgi:hypothetical protein